VVCEASPARMRFSLSDLGGIGCWAAGGGSGRLKADRGKSVTVSDGPVGCFWTYGGYGRGRHVFAQAEGIRGMAAPR
jgi:hypothetical protein